MYCSVCLCAQICAEMDLGSFALKERQEMAQGKAWLCCMEGAERHKCPQGWCPRALLEHTVPRGKERGFHKHPAN